MLTALFCWFLLFLPSGSTAIFPDAARDPTLLATSSLASDLQFPAEFSTLFTANAPHAAFYCFINAVV